jgi:flagellar secretion chaperone FliS
MNTMNARARFVADGMATLTGPRLLVALYARLLRDLDDAAVAVSDGAAEAAHANLTHAQEIVYELMLALDGDVWAPAAGLADLYDWVYRRLIHANITKDAAAIAECRQVLAPLHDAWTEAANGTTSAAS